MSGLDNEASAICQAPPPASPLPAWNPLTPYTNALAQLHRSPPATI